MESNQTNKIPDSLSEEVAYNLSLSIEQRLQQHQQALDLLIELENQRLSREKQSEHTSPASH